MGAWGANSFQNDWALDWIGDLIDSNGHSLVRNTLMWALRHDGFKREYIFWICVRKRKELLPATLATEAMAAAELVAARFGCPPNRLPNGIQDWLAGVGKSLEQDLIGIALDAIARILDSSELKTFWDEGGLVHADQWYRAVDELKQRLNKCSEGNYL